MPNLEYPQPLAAPFGPFPAINDILKPPEAQESTRLRRQAVIHIGQEDIQQANLRHAPSPLIGVTKLHVSVGGDHSTSFHNGADTQKADAIEACVFCPDEDDAVVSWKVRHYDDIAVAVLVVRSPRLNSAVSFKNITAELNNGRGVAPGCNGGLPMNEAIAIQQEHAQLFPEGVLTAEHAPYRFEIQITPRRGSGRMTYPTHAWTFAQVLVHSLDLHWGEAAHVPVGAQPEVIDPLNDNRFRGLENTLVTNLLQNGDITADQDLVLDTDLFAAGRFDAAGQIQSNVSGNADALLKTWGHGPRIPLEVTVFARKHDGSVASLGASRKAVGRVFLLWDWEGGGDPLADWTGAAKAGWTQISGTTLRRFLDQAEPLSPVDSYNCPYDRGGKRGATTHPVFMEQNDITVWGNTVQLAGGNRPWASVSRTGGGGLRRAKSTVLFQPAPVIGDRYRVAVYLTHDHVDPTPDATPDMNVPDVPGRPGTNQAPPVVARPLAAQWRGVDQTKRPPRATSGLFEIKRRAKVRIVEYPAGAAGGIVAGVRAYYEGLCGLTLDLDQATMPNAVLQAAYTSWWNTNAFNCHLVDRWAIDLANGPGAQAIPALTYLQFQNKVEDHFRHGLLYEAEVGNEPDIGSFVSQVKDIFVWGSGPATVGALGRPAWGIYGSVDRNQDILQGDIDGATRFRRCCFGVIAPGSQQDANLGNYELFLDLTANGHTETVHITWSRFRLTRPKIGKAIKRQILTALQNLVGHLGAGPFDVQLDIVTRGNTTQQGVLAWEQVTRVAAREVLDQNFVPIDVATLRHAFFTRRYNGKPEALSQTVYETAARKTIKGLLLPMADHVRLNAQVNFAGLVYLCLAPASSLGNFGVGANNTGGRIGVGYVTEFPVAGFAQQRMIPLQDVFDHELGHAFWRNHCPTASFGFVEFDGERGHTPFDTCLMNYDVDPHSMNFCAHCVLLLRGWKDLDDKVDRAEAAQLLEAEILAEGDARAKAWKELRRARLEPLAAKGALDEREAAEAAWRQQQPDTATANNRAQAGRQAANDAQAGFATARQWVAQAEQTCAANFAGADGLSLLRALVRANLWVADYANAWALWGQLRGISALVEDQRDIGSFPNPMLPGIVQTIEVEEGVNHINTAIVQCLNLPADAKYVDGHHVTHLHRLGRRVRLYITTTGPVREIRWALLRHAQDGLAPHETVVVEPYKSADPNFTGAVWIKGTPSGREGWVQVDNTHFTIDLELPERGGRYKVAIAGGGGTVLSQEIRAVRTMFVMSTVVQGPAAGNATTDNDAVNDLNAAYAGAGVHFVAVGRTQLVWPGGVYADDMDGNAKATPFAQAAHQTRTQNAANAFTGQLTTYEDHAPYLAHAIYVQSLTRSAGLKTHAAAINTNLGAPIHTFNVVSKGNFPAQVWEGDPADADPDANGLAPEYAGRGTAKAWVLTAKFTPQGGVAADVPLDRIDAQASDGAFPARLDRVTVDLTAFANGGNIVGQLQLVLVTAKFVAGVDASRFAPARGMTILVADHAAPVQRSALAHEIGHMLGLVSNDGRHPSYYDVGSGPHCHAGFAKYAGAGLGEDYYRNQLNSAACIMYHRVRAANPIQQFCADCTLQASNSTWKNF